MAAATLISTCKYSSFFDAVQDAAASALFGPQLGRLCERQRHVLMNGLWRSAGMYNSKKLVFQLIPRVPDGYTGETLADFLLEKAASPWLPKQGLCASVRKG